MGTRIIHDEFLKVGGTDVSSYTFTNGTAVTTDAIQVRYSNGFSALDVAFISGNKDLDITFQVSLDGKTFKTAYDTDGTAINKIATATLTGDQYIVFEPPATRWIRFVIDPDATGVATIKYVHQEE